MDQADSKNFDELVAADPTILDDPARMSALFQEHPDFAQKLGQETELYQDDTASQSATAQPDPAAASSSQNTDAAENTEAPAGVAAKDGKHVIPYQVLEQARTGKAAAEARVAQLETQLAQFQKQSNSGDDAAAAATAAAAREGFLTEEQLAALDEEAPVLAKAQRAIQARMVQLENQVAKVTPVVARAEAQEEQRVQLTVDETIDRIPDLSNWRAKSPALWSRAVAVDDLLKADPAWQGKPLEERFKEAARLVRTEIEGAGYTVSGTPANKPADQAAVLKARADAALKDAEQVGVRPVTLSDLPGGTLPGPGVDENLANVDVVALANTLASMSPEQQDAYLNKFVR